jgi:4-amino-4-deoxy-L-arabinose transferase
MHSNNAIRHAVLTVVLLGALLALGLGLQGQRGVFETTEGRYSGVASEMLRLNDWLVPRLSEEEPHLTKPPLTYWLLAASINALGRTEMAVRLPGAMAFVLTVLVVARAGRLLTPGYPLLPAIIYATFLFPATVSNVISTDNILTLAEVAGMVAFASHYFAERPRRLSPATLGWACFGLAFFTKGYPALLPMIALGLFHYWRGRHISDDRLFPLSGMLIFAVLGAGWFVVIISRDPTLLQYFVVDELFGRVSGQHDRNPEWYRAFTVYGPVILLGSIPWTLSAARALRESFRDVLPGVRREGPVAAKRQDIVLYLVLWLVVPTIVFLLVKSRLPLYLLPQFAPLALVTAVSMSHKALRPYSVALKACAGAAIVLTLRLAAAEMSSDNDSRHAADQIAALPGEVPGEIVFVDARPYRGIAFYLGVEVEHVALTSETAESLGVETVDEELDDLEAERVWLVPTLLIDQFRTRAAAKGAGALTMLGEIITDGPFMALALESPSAAVAGNVELDPLTTGLVRDDVYCCHIPSEAPEDTKRRDEREPRPLVADE